MSADEKVIDGLIYLIEQSGGHAVGIRADVGTEAGVQTIYDKAIEAFGDIDVWVNNAGFEIQSAAHET